MITKTFEIRDRGTFIPAIAIKLRPGNDGDCFLIARAGYGGHEDDQSEYILLMALSGGNGQYQSDPNHWIDSRTWTTAHKHIQENFDSLESGAVIDVEYVLKEKNEPKISEKFDGWGH